MTAMTCTLCGAGDLRPGTIPDTGESLDRITYWVHEHLTQSRVGRLAAPRGTVAYGTTAAEAARAGHWRTVPTPRAGTRTPRRPHDAEKAKRRRSVADQPGGGETCGP